MKNVIYFVDDLINMFLKYGVGDNCGGGAYLKTAFLHKFFGRCTWG